MTTTLTPPTTPQKSSPSSTSDKPTWRDYLTATKPVGSAKQGLKVIKWIQANCVHTNDRWLGKPFNILPWQYFVILALFTTGADGLRVVRWALVGIAKKNSKTELAAALACYFAFGPSGPDGQPEPSALVVCAAGSDDQADMIFGAAKVMCEHSPTLSQITETYESEILCPSLPGSKIVRVAAAAKKGSSTLDGKNIYVVICDELHCWEGPQGRTMWEVLTNASVTRRQPLVFQITTAGYDLDSVCGEQYIYGKAVAAGEVKDPAFLFWWVEPPEGAPHDDPAVIEAANPSFGKIAQLAFYLDQLTKKPVATFRRYFLNQWTESAESWLPEGAWDACEVPPFDFDPGLPMFGFTDASTKHDSTAHVIGQWNPDNGKLRLRATIWERPLDPATKRPLEGWKLPIVEIENKIREFHRDYDLHAWGYDPALFERSAQQLETEGLPMEEVPQSDARMVPAAQTLYQLISEGLVEHEGNAVFTRHIKAAVAVQARGGNGGWRLSKGKTKRKMDGAISAAGTALLAAYAEEEEGGPNLW